MLDTGEMPRLRLLLDHFALIEDDREPWRVDLVAIDGKTSRGSHDRGNGRAALHLVSAFATRERLVIGQEAVAEGSCEQDTIPLLLERLAASGGLDGALVTIGDWDCQDFRVRTGIMGEKESPYVPTQGAGDPG